MKHPLALALAVALGTGLVACSQTDASPQSADAQAADSQGDAAVANNPFFTESPLPLHFPRFDQIKDSHFGPAFDRGMADHLKEVEAIASNPEEPTFDNTIIALEKSGEILSRTASVFFSLVGADTGRVRAEAVRAQRCHLAGPGAVRAHPEAVRQP